jgi:hypothetical protein
MKAPTLILATSAAVALIAPAAHAATSKNMLHQTLVHTVLAEKSHQTTGKGCGTTVPPKVITKTVTKYVYVPGPTVTKTVTVPAPTVEPLPDGNQNAQNENAQNENAQNDVPTADGALNQAPAYYEYPLW